jgi:glycosyltransferase involved in cell wall biosynthesis
MPRLVHLITAQPAGTQFFQQHQLEDLQRRGFDVVAISAPSENLDVMAREAGIAYVAVPMERDIAPLKDIVSLFRMFRALARLRPDIVTAGSPKAALLGLISSALLFVPARVYVLRGLRLETTRGPLRWILAAVEWITSLCAHRVICVSESLRVRYLEGRYTSAEKAVVLASGSSNGIDVERYRPCEESRRNARRLREEMNIPEAAVVVGYVGRVTVDKGGRELIEAYELVRREHPETYLLVIGDFETGVALSAEEQARLLADPRVRKTGFVWDPIPYYGIMDVLAFPSLREGFPRSPLEAAAAEIPVVGFAATGTVDSIVDGHTGAIVPLKDSVAMAVALSRYVGDRNLRLRHGQAGRERVEREFTNERVWDAFYEEYARLLREKGVDVPDPAAPSEVPRGNVSV